jgi:hypothetical protein
MTNATPSSEQIENLAMDEKTQQAFESVLHLGPPAPPANDTPRSVDLTSTALLPPPMPDSDRYVNYVAWS